MKIFSAEQIRQLDAFTIANEPIRSIDLMERASRAFVKWFVDRFHRGEEIFVFCGPGNNGGDGLAVSRILLEANYRVRTFILTSDSYSEDFKTNQSRLSRIATLFYIKSGKDTPTIPKEAVVIDAVFGSGLTRPVEGLFAEVIQGINQSKAKVISIDIASGLFADCSNKSKDIIVEPDFTVSFQLPKLAFMLPQNEKYVGEWYAEDIRLSQEFIDNEGVNYYYTTATDIKSLLKRRSKFSHKGNFGKSLLIGGSYGMVGAITLAVKACLRTGTGLSVAYVPTCGYEILQSAVPESIVMTDKEKNFITDIPDLNSFNAVGIGPGLGKNEMTVAAFKKLLEFGKPVVIDADGLNILAENKELMEIIPAASILTPHPKEFERLAGKVTDDFQRLELLKKFSADLKSIIVLKGAHTAIASPEEKIYFNSTGNPGMATGGSGDVLTGIIVSLLGQGYTSWEAAVIGVYIHGYAGDAAAKEKSEVSLLPSDIIEAIPEFYKVFSSSSRFK